MRPGVNGTLMFWPAFLRRLLDAGAAAENDQVRERHFLAAGLRLVEFAVDALQHF